MGKKLTVEQEIHEALGTDEIYYDIEKLFPRREGLGARAQVRTKLKLLKNLHSDLSTALIDGERVLYAARGVTMNSWEMILAGGLVAHLANMTCIILTNYRILLVNCDNRGKQRHFRNQLLYTEISKTKMSSILSRASQLKLKDRKTLTIGGFRGRERKLLQTYISDLVSGMPSDAPQVEKSIQHLCPYCPERYLTITDECRGCKATFKSPKKAALRSLFLPGLGDMYLGHTLFGSLEILGSLTEWVILISAIADFKAGTPDALGFLIFWIIVMIITNIIDYFLTLNMGRKGLIADSKSKPALRPVSA